MQHHRIFCGAFIVIATLTGGSLMSDEADSIPGLDPTYAAEVEEWRERRADRLRAPDGWLTLVGLEWLREGAQSFGSYEGNDIVLPRGQGTAGILRRSGATVTVEVAAGAGVRAAGEVVEVLELATDADGPPTVLEYEEMTFYLISRGDRIGLRIKDRKSETLAKFEGLEYYPIDPQWKVVGRFEPGDSSARIAVPSVLGTIGQERSPGKVVLELDGRLLTLDALAGGDDDELFLVFGDTTNGEDTYGGGRFLYAKVSGNEVTLDFNQAYNPPCVFTAYATCPLPPRQNRLPVAITAGEKMFADGAH